MLREPYGSEKLKKLEEQEKYVRERYGDNYYENLHNQYQRETDFEGIIVSIVFVFFLVMFLSCIKG